MVEDFIYYIGLLICLRFLFDLVWTFLVYHVLPERFTLIPGAWALVTGASRGIGRAYVQQLAKKHYNLILVARSESQLADISKEIQQKYQIQAKILAADLSMLHKDDQLKNKFREIFNENQCQLLVNNAGINTPKYIEDLPQETLDQIYSVNTYPHVFLTKVFLQSNPQIRKGVIDLSSAGARVSASRISLYNATKAFSDNLARSNSYQGKNYYVSVRPAEVETDMLDVVKMKFLVSTPEDLAKASLKCLGWKNLCRGPWMHFVQSYFIEILPQWIQNKMTDGMFNEQNQQ